MSSKRMNRKLFTYSSLVQRFKQEDGSTLILAVFLILLLLILGLAVMGATIGGAERTETRESDVQSLHLAQKGLDEATAYIESRLKGLNDIDPDKVEDILASINEQNLNVTTELGTLNNTASGEIQDIKYSGKEAVTDLSQQSRKYYIDVTTSANVNGVDRKLKQRITLDSYPDFLKYAFGSEQTLRLNGPAQLKGNIYAGNQLVITDNADYSYKGMLFHFPTLYPSLMEKPGETASGEVHVQSWDSIKYADGSAPPSGSAPLASLQKGDAKVSDILNIPPEKVKIKEQKKFVQINVEESFWDKLTEALNPAVDFRDDVRSHYAEGIPSLNAWLKAYPSIPHLKKPVLPEKEPISADDDPQTIAAIEQKYQDDLNAYYHMLDTQLTEFHNDSAVFDENLTVDNVDYKGISFTDQEKQGAGFGAPKWLIVAGDLTIDNYKSDFLNVKGNILVTGNLTIRGNVAFDATVFVLGTTTVEDATIHGLNGKELIVISKQQILLTRIDSFSNSSEEMKAFFYTDSSGELYGVGSIFWLNGGFFAKGNLTVNAVVGEVQPPPDGNLGAGFQFKTQQPGQLTRFIIDYNNKIYTDQQASLPRVKSVSMSVSPVELVKN